MPSATLVPLTDALSAHDRIHIVLYNGEPGNAEAAHFPYVAEADQVLLHSPPSPPPPPPPDDEEAGLEEQAYMGRFELNGPVAAQSEAAGVAKEEKIFVGVACDDSLPLGTRHASWQQQQQQQRWQ